MNNYLNWECNDCGTTMRQPMKSGQGGGGEWECSCTRIEYTIAPLKPDEPHEEAPDGEDPIC